MFLCSPAALWNAPDCRRVEDRTICGARGDAARKSALVSPPRFKPRTTDSEHDARVNPNLLKEAANEPSTAGEVIVGDITYISLRDGSFCYLAVFQDKFTRRIVGWALSARMTTQLVIDAFQMARRRGLVKRGAIIHTDRGSQYAAVEFRRLLYIYGFRQSMSAKGNC